MIKLVKRMNKYLWLLIPFFMNAQQQEILSLELAIQKGMEYSKQLKISQSKLDGFKAKIAQTKNALIPTISVSANYTRISDNITPTQLYMPGLGQFVLNPQILNQSYNRASFYYPVFAGFRTKNALESFNYLEKATQLDIEKDKTEIKFNIISAYYNVLRTQNSLIAVDSTIQQLTQKANEVKNLEKSGIALQNDVLKADLALTSAKVTREDVYNSLQVAVFNLNLLLGQPTDAKPVLQNTNVEAIAALTTIDAYLTDAAKQRSDIQSLFYRTQAQQSIVKQQRANYWPIFALGANYYYYSPNPRIFPQSDQFKGTWDVGATISWNLTNLITTNAFVRDAKATLSQNQLNYEMLNDNMRTEVFTNFSACKTLSEKIKLNELSVQQANENLRLLNSRFKNDMALLSDLLEAEFMVLQAKVNLLNTQIDSNVAYFRLIKSTGK